MSVVFPMARSFDVACRKHTLITRDLHPNEMRMAGKASGVQVGTTRTSLFKRRGTIVGLQ